MKQKRKKLGRKLLGFLLTLAMVVGPMPGMGMTALAVDADLELGEGDLESANQSRNLAVDANGVIHIVYQKTDGSIVYTKSTNSGVSFSDDVTVANNGSECEVAVSSNGRVYVAYHNGSKGYVAYSDDGNNFTSVELSGSDGTSIHLATDGDYVYAIQQYGTALYYSSDKGVTYKSHTGWTGYAYSDVHVDTSNHKVIVLKDNPSVVCRVSEDYGVNFTEEVPVKCNDQQIAVYYSTATVGSGYAYMSGQDGKIYKINYNDATATEKTVNASSVSTGRSLSSDENNNVIVGYVNDGKVYYQLSTDGGTTFEDGIAVADATAANAAINIKTGDVLFLYSKDGKIMLHREIGVIKGNVNYINDSIEGLEPNMEYMVEVLGDNDTVTATYYISSNETGNIPFIGIDKDGNAYEDLAGKKIKITKAGTSDVSDPIDIEKRPTPDDAEQTGDNDYSKPVDVSDNEVLTTENSITIHPSTEKAKQKYRIYNANGTEIAGQDWVSVGENGDIVFSGLSEHTEYLIKAIVPATQTKPRSYESEGVKITTMGTIEVTNPTELSFVQDGLEHEFEITTTPADAKKEYSLLPEENYTEEIVKLKDPGRYTVYYKASKDNYRTVYGSFDVEIREAAPADIVAVAKDYNGVYDGKAHSIEIEVVAPQTGAAVSYGTKEGEYTLTANPSYTDVGTYKVFYRVTAEGRNEKTGSADIVIEKADSTVTTAPAAKTLTYNGQAQELVTAGTASGGTMKYAVTTANQEPAAEAYTFDNTSIPAKTAAGTYYVWYKAVGDETHTDSEAKCITVTISSESSGGGGGSSSSGGGSSTPSTPTTPTESYTVPVSSENTVNVTTNISNGTAVVSEITQSDIDKIVDNGNNSGGGDNTEASENTSITIDLSQVKSEVTSVQLTKETVEKLTEAVNAHDNLESVEIKMSKATVELDGKALSAVSEQAEGSSIKLVVKDTQTTKLNASQQESLKQFTSAQPFQAYFESKGKEIHDFKGGKATVSIKFSPETGKDVKYYHMYYLPLAGAIERYETRYIDGMLNFVTGHFSDYAIVYDETRENETGKEDEADNTDTDDNNGTDAGKTTEETSETTANGKTAYQNALSINKGLKVSQTGNKITVSWGKVSGADRYEIYAAYCTDKFGKKPVKIITKKDVTSVTITKLNGKKLVLTKNFKAYVVAYKTVDGSKKKLGKTITAHIVGRKNKTYTNVKAIKLAKNKTTIKVGKTYKIKASVVLVDSKKKMLSDKHAATFRYASSNKKIAAVDKNGKVIAKKVGTCYILVYAKNGYAKKVKITVK